EGLQATGFSGYEVTENDWDAFVKENNALGEEFLRSRESSATEVYILTTASQQEMHTLKNIGDTL
ncbi:MAG TPA: hypothetical protein VJU82_16405, partial [Acidobacteriaceae bacterium]|nr:hypothetical protein [Acidobacteriaceae bacterium]